MVIYCSKCGSKNDDVDKYCSVCGTKLKTSKIDTFECPHCNESVDSRKLKSIQTVKCPHCGEVLKENELVKFYQKLVGKIGKISLKQHLKIICVLVLIFVVVLVPTLETSKPLDKPTPIKVEISDVNVDTSKTVGVDGFYYYILSSPDADEVYYLPVMVYDSYPEYFNNSKGAFYVGLTYGNIDGTKNGYRITYVDNKR